MPTIQELLDDVVVKEGGYNDIAEDAGGATNYGISLKYAQTVGDRDHDGQLDLDINHDGKVDKEDIKILPKDVAEKLYLRDFFVGPHIDKMPISVQPILFDCAINHGPSRGIEFVQEVVNLAGFGPIKEDGVIGPTTIRMAMLCDREMGPFFVNAVVDQRLAFYDAIVKANPSQAKFINGWRNRANSFKVAVQ